MKKRMLFIVVGLLVLLAALYWVLSRNSQTLPQGIAGINGRLTVERVDVASLYAGKVAEIYIQEGDYVNQDQPLVRLDASQIEAQLAQAQAAEQQAKQAVQRAQAEINAYQQQRNIAQLDYNNAQRLRQEKLISPSELERREANYQASQATLSGAIAAKAQAEAQLLQAQAKVAEVADRQNDLLITAPLKGRVEYRLVDLGNVVAAGGKIASILNLDDVYINIFLPAALSNQVQLGDEARIVVEGISKPFPAKVVYIASDAQFTPKSVETAEERTKLMFKIKLQIPQEVVQQQQNQLKGGMPAMGYVKYQADAKWPKELQ